MSVISRRAEDKSGEPRRVGRRGYLGIGTCDIFPSARWHQPGAELEQEARLKTEGGSTIPCMLPRGKEMEAWGNTLCWPLSERPGFDKFAILRLFTFYNQGPFLLYF